MSDAYLFDSYLFDSYLFDLGLLLFACWGVIVAIVSVAAFGRDLFPRTRLDSTTKKN